MICRDMNGILISARTGAELPRDAGEHIETCPECRALVSSVDSADAQYPVDAAVLDQIRKSNPAGSEGTGFGKPTVQQESRNQPAHSIVYAAFVS